jgi:UDP-N-acetyl-D-glucosamine dehydrogenase
MNNNFIYLKERITVGKAKIAVVGLGYVGLPLALSFVKKGFSVLGIDVDIDRINRIRQGKSYITDVSAVDLKDSLNSRRFKVSNNFKDLSNTEVILICVPTPLKYKYTPDISYIKEAVNKIAKNIKKPSLIVLESTTYPGTTEEFILPLLERNNLKHREDFYLCFSPERIDPGNKKYTLENIPKIVGGLTAEDTELAVILYKNITKEVIPVSSARTAEFVKLLENTFRLINIGLIYELTMLAHKMKVDIWEVIEAAKTKPFGFMPFYPGPGVGGHCIPKDPLYLHWKAKRIGYNLRFVRVASEITSLMPKYIVERVTEIIKKKYPDRRKLKVLIIGVTYKKDVKDLRKSPALEIIDEFKKRGVKVSYFDPLIPYLKINNINLKSLDLKKIDFRKFGCVVIISDHSEIDYNFIFKKSLLIFDTRNVYKNIKDEKVIKI